MTQRRAVISKPLLVRIIVFIVVTPVAMLVLVIVTSLLISGRGFLPQARNEILLHLHQSPDGAWTVASSEIVPPDFQWPELESRANVLVQESSTGRWRPGKFSAWRARTWVIADWHGAGTNDINDPESPLSHAVRSHVEQSIIPQSSLWKLWPQSHLVPVIQSSAGKGPFIWRTRSSSSPLHSPWHDAVGRARRHRYRRMGRIARARWEIKGRRTVRSR